MCERGRGDGARVQARIFCSGLPLLSFGCRLCTIRCPVRCICATAGPLLACATNAATACSTMQPIHLPKQRRMKIVGTIDDDTAMCVIDRLLAFEEQDPEQPVQILINSSGGKLSPACAIVDVMASLSCPVYTTALGRCESAATLILAAGEPGHRVVHPSTRLMIHKVRIGTFSMPSIPGVKAPEMQGVALEVRRLADEVEVSDELLVDMMAKLTRQTKAKLKKDLEHDTYMSAAEAVAYGLADMVPAPRSKPSKKRKAPAARG